MRCFDGFQRRLGNVIRARFLRVVVVAGDYNMARIGKRVIVIVVEVVEVVEVDVIIALRLLLPVGRVAALQLLLLFLLRLVWVL